MEGDCARTRISRCLVLGAGFSRAVSEDMPLTDELGRLVLAQPAACGLVGPAAGFSGGYFESWLSRLAEPQPDLTDAENLHNQAWFSTLTEQVWQVLSRREAAVCAGPPPEWLARLIGVAHRTRSTVVTFNYDTLLEAAFNTQFVYDWEQRARAMHRHLLRNLPEEPVRAGILAHSPADTLQLIKLHGSLDCWWVSGDMTGASIQRSSVNPAFGRSPEKTARARPPGRTPFLVPPASAKSRFYANPITRELWQQAAQAIGDADRVDLIGYSLPVTDQVTTGMLSDRLSGRDVEVRVVNPSPAAPMQSLEAVGISPVACTEDMNAYALSWETEVGTQAWGELDGVADDVPVLIGNNPGDVWAVIADGDRLVAEHAESSVEAMRPRAGGCTVPTTVGNVRQRANPLHPLVVEDQGAVRTWRSRRRPLRHMPDVGRSPPADYAPEPPGRASAINGSSDSRQRREIERRRCEAAHFLRRFKLNDPQEQRSPSSFPGTPST